MILLIDNYDSFAYNLYHLIASVYPDIVVKRNDEITIDDIDDLHPEAIVISPGPGKPSEAGIIEDVILQFYDKLPILGVCLGHQAIIEAMNGKVTYAKKIMHGKTSLIDIDNQCPLFHGFDKQLKVARYHSLAGDKKYLPSSLKVIGCSQDGEVMAIAHRDYPVYGVQFHPESFLSDGGELLIQNFIKEIKK